MTTNPYQAPETVPDGPANIDFDSLPLTVPRRSRLERVYPILLGLWSAGMALLCFFGSHVSAGVSLGDWITIAYFVVVAIMSVGIWRGSRAAEIVAIIQLAIVWLLATGTLCLAAWLLISNKAVSPDASAAVICVLLVWFVLFLPTTVLLVLAWFVSRQRSN